MHKCFGQCAFKYVSLLVERGLEEGMHSTGRRPSKPLSHVFASGSNTCSAVLLSWSLIVTQ